MVRGLERGVHEVHNLLVDLLGEVVGPHALLRVALELEDELASLASVFFAKCSLRLNLGLLLLF